MIIILFLYFLMASTFTLAKAAVNIISPIFFIAARMLIAGSALFSFIYFFKKQVLKFSKQHLLLFAEIIFFHIFFAYILEFWALQKITSSKACLYYNLSPFFTALFAYLLFNERLNRRKIIGLLIGFGGTLPLLWESGIFSCPGFFSISWADIALIAAVISATYGWIVMKELVVMHRYSPLLVNGIGMFFGGLLALVTSLYIEGFPPHINVVNNSTGLLAHLNPMTAAILSVLFYLCMLIIIANFLGYNLYAYLMHHYSITLLSFVGLITPLFASLLGFLFLSEKINCTFVISFFITSIGLYIFYKDELKSTLDLKK